jgi:hypothetical protein
LIAALSLPVADGLKVTVTTQLAPVASELGQLLVWLKSALLVPVIERLAIDNAALPLLDNAKFCPALGVFRS